MHTKRQVAVPLVAAVGLVVRGCAGKPVHKLTSNVADGPG